MAPKLQNKGNLWYVANKKPRCENYRCFPFTYRVLIIKSELGQYVSERSAPKSAPIASTAHETPSSNTIDKTKYERTMEIARRGMNKYREALLELAK